MKNLLIKEAKLATPLLTYLFLLFGLMTMIPGYPILCGAFFVCFGIFQGYQYSREANDTLYSVLLPVCKKDIVTAKYLFAVMLQMAGFLLMVLCTLVRMTLFADAAPYVTNVLMAANPVFLAFVLIIFAMFNLLFLSGFFRTAYGIGKPFILFIIAAFFTIGLAETLHHLPGLHFLNDIQGEAVGIQLGVLLVAVAGYIAVTWLSCKCARKNFEIIDL